MHGDDTLERFEHARGGGPGAIEPLDLFVLIEPVEDETETTGGLIIPASADSACLSGVVVAVGDEVQGVSPGDKVLYPRSSGYELTLGGEPKRLVDRRELIARLTD